MKCQSLFSFAAILVAFGVTVGCSNHYGEGTERRRTSTVIVDETDAADVPRIRVNTPGATVDTERGSSVLPDADRKVDVNVGPGGVRVDVDGKPLREHLRETPPPRTSTDSKP